MFAATPIGTYPFGGTASASVTDADGTTAKFSLPGGQGVITVADDGWHVAISKATAASSLSITTTGGDGRVTLAEFSTSKPLGSIDAPKANLSGSMNVTRVKSVTLGNLSDLSLASSSPLASLTVASWSDPTSPPDSLTLPSVTSLSVKGNFAPAVTISSKKVALNSATVGGTVSGTWAIAGSAGTLKLHAVRSPDLTIGGSVTQLSLDDNIAVSQVDSSTGGVIHFGGKGAISASKGKDKFQVAKNITIYTCDVDAYQWADLYQYNHLGRTWTQIDNGKKAFSHVLPTTQRSNGHDTFTIQDTGGDGPGSETYYVDDQGRGHILGMSDHEGSFRFSDLLISPTVYRLGVVTQGTSKGSGSFSEDGLSANFSGAAAFATRLVGHELVTTPAGTFLTVKLASTLNGSFAGAISNGQQSLGIKYSLSGSVTEYAVPGLGLVKYDDYMTAKMSAPSLNESETNKSTDHVVLAKRPTDSI